MIESLIAAAFLLPATIAALYYFVLCSLTRFASRTSPRASPTIRFVVLVPAHNEALSMPATLASIQRSDYPAHLVRTVVIADNCSDDTAMIARRAGVQVIERHDRHRRGKGYALEFALNEILPTRPDAVLLLDADGELAPAALRIFDAKLVTGEVVQGSIRTKNIIRTPGELVAAVGNVLDDAVAAGRDRLRFRVPLRGSNMAFRRDVLERIPWTCHGLTEDAEYSAKLRAAGVRVHFEPSACVRSESPGDGDSLDRQRARWCHALQGRAWLDSKPAVLAHLGLTTLITIVAAAMVERQLSVVLMFWLAAIWLLTSTVYITALLQVGDGLSTLLGVPRVVLRLFAISLRRRESTWHRTRRIAES